MAASKHSSALMRMVSVLAALNTGKVKPDDMFDSGVGIFVYDNDTIYDHNWRKGGYYAMGFRHAFVLISIVAAVITPPDLFTCIMVLLPMYGFYEVSIFVVSKVCQ